MLSSYIKLALRNLAKHRLYAVINITGLALGMTLFLFSSILLSYETNHDSMFSARDRIFLVASVFSPTAGETPRELSSTYTALAPILDMEIAEAEQVARVMLKKQLLAVDNNNFYTGVRFAEPGFTRMFDFRYIHGDRTAIDDPHGLIVTASTAKKLFGRTDVLDEVVSLNHDYDMHVTAVIEDVPVDSHFNSSPIPDTELTAIAPYEALYNIDSYYTPEGLWAYVSMYDTTYIMLSENKGTAWLQDQINTVYARHAPEKTREYVSSLKAVPLIKANTEIWESLGFPVLESVRLLGILVLIIACVNYANLATAQSFGRTREVGLRKTLGAGRTQLLTQFLVESLAVSACAMVLALAGIELLVPLYNDWTGKVVTLDYTSLLPWLILTAFITGLLAGAYPAYLISRLNPIDSLHNTLLKGRKGGMFRGFMIAAQFAVSIFMLAMVMIVYFQNEKVREASNIFPKSRIVLLGQLDTKEISTRRETLRGELERVQGVEAVTFCSHVPFEQWNVTRKVTPVKGDETLSFKLNHVYVDFDYLKTYDIDLFAGRTFDRNIANDLFKDDVEQVNVIINRMAAEKLGFGRGAEAIGKSFYRLPYEDDDQTRQFTVIGLIPDQRFNGAFSDLKPMVLVVKQSWYRYASIRVSGYNLTQTLQGIDDVWKRVIPDYPVQRRFLDDVFNSGFNLFRAINNVLAGFAGIALSLALIGLFGLAAFMAQRRTREIGIRKVMGASVSQIVRLLIWQFSRPVIWSLVLAMPLAWLASGLYLDFFGERISFVVPIIVLASVTGVLTAWIIVAGHAINVARAAPIHSLRYE